MLQINWLICPGSTAHLKIDKTIVIVKKINMSIFGCPVQMTHCFEGWHHCLANMTKQSARLCRVTKLKCKINQKSCTFTKLNAQKSLQFFIRSLRLSRAVIAGPPGHSFSRRQITIRATGWTTMIATVIVKKKSPSNTATKRSIRKMEFLQKTRVRRRRISLMLLRMPVDEMHLKQKKNPKILRSTRKAVTQTLTDTESH